MKSILLAMSDSSAAERFGALLEKMGCKVVGVAATGRRAVEMAAERKPDLAIVDFSADGDEAAREIRAAGPHVFFLSGWEKGTGANGTGPDSFTLKLFSGDDSGSALEAVRGCLEGKDGCVAVESQEEAERTIKVYLAEDFAASVFGGEETKAEPRTRVLMMDDEEMFLEMMAKILERFGFEVETAVDGKEAIEKYHAAGESGSPFRAVVLDLAIPGGMGGRQAIGYLREIDPGVKAVVTSGYSTDDAMTHFQKHGFAAALEKPFQPCDLVTLLRRLTDGPDDGRALAN